jgi:probable HAF family extracellular repeat protein
MPNLRQCAIWVLGISLLAPLVAAQSYAITDLGLLPGSYETYAQGVNDLMQVTGGAGFSGTSEAILWTERDGIRQLKTLEGYTYLNAYGINNLGDAVGGAVTPSGGHVMLWTHDGEVRDLGAPGSKASTAYGVNDLGVIAGWEYFGPAFIWSRGEGFRVIGTLPGGNFTVASHINLHNHVVGFADFPNNTAHAFLWTPEKGMRDLGVPGGDFSEATGNNNFGQIVGYAESYFGEHAVLWQEDGEDVIDLGILVGDDFSVASAVNDVGEVVGYSHSPYGSAYNHAFVWTRRGGMEDLNDLIPGGSGWVLNYATSINLEGMICGYGALNGETRAFLLTPISY